MALKEKLRDLSKGLEGVPHQQVIAEWTKAVAEALESISGMLAEYLNEKLVSIAMEDVTVNEDGLEPYQSKSLNVKSGAEVIVFQPVGRFVAGADGRIDIYNRKHPQRKILLLRIAHEEKFFWAMFIPKQLDRISLNRLAAELETRPFNKESLDLAIEILLD